VRAWPPEDAALPRFDCLSLALFNEIQSRNDASARCSAYFVAFVESAFKVSSWLTALIALLTKFRTGISAARAFISLLGCRPDLERRLILLNGFSARARRATARNSVEI